MRGRVRHARRGRSTNTMMSWEVASSQHLVSFFMPTAERTPCVQIKLFFSPCCRKTAGLSFSYRAIKFARVLSESQL